MRSATLIESRTAPLTFHQERLWFIDAFERDRVYDGPPTYHNVPVWLWIRGTIDASTLAQALDVLVARHDALRTDVHDGQQRIRTRMALPLEIADVPALADDALLARAEADRRRPFLLDQGPLIRATLYRRTAAPSLLSLVIHHIVADLRSTRILVEELIQAYRAIQDRRDPTRPDAPGFAAYAAWLRALPETAFDQVRAFWMWQLEGGLAPLELPYINGRHRIHVYAAAGWRVDVGGADTAALDALAARERVTLADVLTAGLVATLYACARQREIVIGTTHPNREGGLEHLIGPLANLLVLRHHVSPARPFRDLLQHAHRTSHQAAANRALPFDRLVHLLDPPRDMSRTALFDVHTQFVDEERDVWSLPEATVTRVAAFAGFGKYDISVTTRRTAHGLTADLLYNEALFQRSFIEELSLLFVETLRRAADDPGAPLRRHVRLPTALAERQTTLLQATPGVEPAYATLDAAFEAVAARGPDRVAIVCDDAHLTYAALAARARRVSRTLAAAGVRPGSPVAAFVDRSAHAIVAMLGILRAGGTYVPVDPAYPPHRIALLIEDAEASIVLTTASLRAALREHEGRRAVPVIEIDHVADDPGRPPVHRTAPDDIAYSIYTSGSTGRPKGCLVTHRNVVSLVLGQSAAFAFTQADVWTWCHSWCFDFSIWEIFGTLLHGGRGVLLTREDVRDPALLYEVLVREQVTVLNQTPAAGSRLAEHPAASAAPASALRWLIFGGDTLAPARLAAWAARHPQLGIVNMYGITETTVHVTRKVLSPEELARDSRSVGRALPTVATYVLGDALELLPLGVLGEIVVAGDGVSLGYWRRPELTAARFVPDPFSGRAGARVYRSGDFGRVQADGEIEFHGRRDHQVKIRGHRIELGEIEAAIADCPGVREAAVVLRADDLGTRRLVAFVAAGDSAIAAATLLPHLQARLTPPMVPSALQYVEALPRTATGKIDRKALEQIALVAPASTRDHRAARDDRERALVRIWEEVLARSPVGIGDDFFEIGGDSILCMQICARAARVGLAIAPKALFEHATIEALCAHLDRAGSEMPPPRAADVLDRQEGGPLLPAQAWFFAQRHPDPHHFNQSVWLDLARDVTAADVEAACRHLQAHHDALRVTFVEGPSGMRQRVRDDTASDVPLTIVAPTGATEAAHRQAVHEAAERAHRGLDIVNGPLSRWLFVPAADDRPPTLLVILHHLIADSVSWRVLIDDLDLLLECRVHGRPLPALPASGSALEYAAACAAQPARPRDDDDVPSVDPSALALPCDGASASLDDNTFEHALDVDVRVPVDETAAMAEALARAGVSWEVALLAAAGEALLAWTGRDAADVYFEGHGRSRSMGAQQVSRTIGWLMALHRIRVRRSDRSMPEHLRELARAVARAKDGPDAFTSSTPGLCVNYLGAVDGLSHGERYVTLRDGESGCPISARNRRAHLIDVRAVIRGGQLHLRWTYGARLHGRDTVVQLADRCTRVLRALSGLRSEVPDSGPAPAPFVTAASPAYPLAPGQLGMLYHALSQPADAPEYVIRLGLAIEGPLDVDAFRASWAHLLARHDALRASFVCDGPDGAVQRFAEQVSLPCTLHDWRDAEPPTREARLDALARATAARAFDLAAPPLLALDLARTGELTHVAILRIHHLLIDGWSLAILRDELLRTYRAQHRGLAADLPPAGRFREYLGWLAAQDWGAAERFWRERLRGLRPCRWPEPGARGTAPVLDSHTVEVFDRPLVRHEGLAGWAARHHLTLNTMVQGMWMLVLGCLTRRSTVAAGVVVAGRPADLPAVERTVGTFINTLPLRAEIDVAATVTDWLARLQADGLAAQRYAACALPQILAWADLPRDHPAFDTVLVCENYPTAPVSAADVRFREMSYAIKESLPVVVEYSCGGRLIGRLRYRPDLASATAVGDAAALLAAAIEELERHADTTVGRLVARLEADAAARARRRQDAFAAARPRLLRDPRAAGAPAAPDETRHPIEKRS